MSADGEALAALGWDDHWAAQAAPHDGTPGRVMRQDRGWVQVATAGGVVSAETRARRTGVPVVGDWVVIDDDMVLAVLERHGVLRRADPRGEGEQLLAANIDVLLVVLGADRPIRAGRVQRSLAQAWDAGAEPVVVLTKVDLADDPASLVGTLTEEHPGLEVYAVSAADGRGLVELRQRIDGRTVVLFGESGAGKSTLLNALAGVDHAETGKVRSSDAKGRHTTTRRELYVLAHGTIVIDTPGIRAIGLAVDVGALDATFPDVEELAAGCRFGDCTHRSEPGCAVKAAVDTGDLPASRIEDYVALRAEIASAADAKEQRRRRGRR